MYYENTKEKSQKNSRRESEFKKMVLFITYKMCYLCRMVIHMRWMVLTQ